MRYRWHQKELDSLHNELENQLQSLMSKPGMPAQMFDSLSDQGTVIDVSCRLYGRWRLPFLIIRSFHCLPHPVEDGEVVDLPLYFRLFCSDASHVTACALNMLATKQRIKQKTVKQAVAILYTIKSIIVRRVTN